MRLQHTSQLTKIILIVEFILVAYLLYALTVNVYKSYRLDLHIASFEEENTKISTDNEEKSTDYLYYRSNQYIDKIAKQNFSLVNPGEEVIVLPAETINVAVESETVAFDAGENSLAELSNSERWWKFFFAR